MGANIAVVLVYAQVSLAVTISSESTISYILYYTILLFLAMLCFVLYAKGVGLLSSYSSQVEKRGIVVDSLQHFILSLSVKKRDVIKESSLHFQKDFFDPHTAVKLIERIPHDGGYPASVPPAISRLFSSEESTLGLIRFYYYVMRCNDVYNLKYKYDQDFRKAEERPIEDRRIGHPKLFLYIWRTLLIGTHLEILYSLSKLATDVKSLGWQI